MSAKIERKSFVIEIKQDDKAGEINGYGAIFGNIDSHDDIIEKGAFEKTLAEHKKNNTLPVMAWCHNMSEPVGDWLNMKENNTGLKVKGQIWIGDNATNESKKAHNFAKGTSKKSLSIGYAVAKARYEKKQGRSIRVIEEAKLYELSLLPYGSNEKAVFEGKSLIDENGEIKTIRDIEQILRDAGLSKTQAKAFLSKGYEGILRDAETKKLEEKETLQLINNLKKSLKG